MTRTASNTDAPLDPPCTRDAEIAAQRVDALIEELIAIPSFRDEAESDCSQEQYDNLDTQQMLGGDEARDEYLDTLCRAFALQKIAAVQWAKGHFDDYAAVNELLRRYRRIEHESSYRSAGNASPRVADYPSPGEPAERPLSTPQEQAATPGPADFSSTDRRAA